MRSALLGLAVSLLAVSAACGEGDPGPTGQPAPSVADGKADGTSASATPKYAELRAFLEENDSAGFDAWQAVSRNLKKEFDDICGDTFCGGDYPPWTITLSCSVAVATSTIKNCSWLFAASYETVHPTRGSIAHHKKFYTCALPWGGLTTQALFTALTPPTGFSDTALRRQLPNGKTTYDGLLDCELGQ